MPTIIVKPSPDVDLYVKWSSVVDNITGMGTRAEMLKEGIDAKRLNRADKTGSSSQIGDMVWDDRQVLVANVQREDGAFFWLRREDLLEYATLYQNDEVTAAEELLEPLDLENME